MPHASIKNDRLVFDFSDLPGYGRDAIHNLSFRRTYRLSEGETHNLPPDLGKLELRNVEGFKVALSKKITDRGGVMFPMHQTEAAWVNFDGYPCAIQIAAGGVNMVNGDNFKEGVGKPAFGKKQGHVVTDKQRWIDGFNMGDGKVRQLVAVPLGKGLTAEAQVTGEEKWGGLQLIVYPMKPEFHRKLQEKPGYDVIKDYFSLDAGFATRGVTRGGGEMGFGAGAEIRQTIHLDDHPEAWDMEHPIRIFVNTIDAKKWTQVTDQPPKHRELTKEDYARANIPFFTMKEEEGAPNASGAKVLKKLETVGDLSAAAGNPLSDMPIVPGSVHDIAAKPGGAAEVKQWAAPEGPKKPGAAGGKAPGKFGPG